MKKMYVARGLVYGDRPPVEAVEVVRDSEKCIWLPTRFGRDERRMKRTEYDCWFDTYEEAAAHQRDKYKRRLESAKAQLKRAEQDLAEIEARL